MYGLLIQLRHLIVRIVGRMSFSEGGSHGFVCLHIFFSAVHSASVL